MSGRIHPAVTVGGKALQAAGYRIPSIIRPTGRPSGHASGRAIDVADWEYRTNYGKADATRIASLLRNATGEKWLVVAEQDHVHAELAPENAIGQKNNATNNVLNIEQGDPIMYGANYALSRAARRLNIATRVAESGDPLGGGSSLSAPLADVVPSEINQMAVAAATPSVTTSKAILAVAQANDPSALERARQIANVRSMMTREVKYIDYMNAEEISSSIGNAAPLRQTDIQSVANDIAGGIPAFEPQVFPFTNVGPLNWEFYPSYALAVSNGGPLDIGEFFKLIGSIIEITVPALTANAGLQVQAFVDFGPVTMNKNQMDFLFRLGLGNDYVKMCAIHGVQTGGVSRLQPRLLTVTGGAPTPGASYPRIRLNGLPAAAGYLPTYRFLQPGDRSVDRFSALLG